LAYEVVLVGLGVLFFLAFGNGANDVGKSVVSLMIDPETAGFRQSYKALLWGGVFSGIGSVSAILIAGRLFSVFTPQSLLLSVPGSLFVLNALIGAAAWVLIGTLLKVPVSTTHAIIGSIIIQAGYLFGISSLEWNFLIWRILLPLAAGPLVAVFGAYLLSRLSRKGPEQAQGLEIDHSKLRASAAEWGSAAAVSFGRGINDAPKMAALGAFFLLGSAMESSLLPYLIVSLAFVVGSLVWGDRVARGLIGHTRHLHPGQRIKAHMATAALVSAGAYFGDPFSTTQVAAGANAGAGKKKRHMLRSSLHGMMLAWLVTLPAAGLLAVAASIFTARILIP
jgi:PiT family inorganic phosphate transporter